jgi:hypothetical protein
MILLNRLWDFLFFVFGEGSWSLRPYEIIVVKAALSSLSEEIRGKIEHQLKSSYFVERTNKHISVIRFYHPNDHLRLDGAEFQDALIRVSTRVDGIVVTTNVTLYKGLIFSVETKKPGKFFAEKKIEVLGVELGKTSQTITGAIDRLEHGRV